MSFHLQSESLKLFTTALKNPLKKTGVSNFRLVSWNAQCAKQPLRLADAIKSRPKLYSADIILLQEVEAHAGEECARAETIAQLCGYECVYLPSRKEDSKTHGLAILSRLPLENTEVIPLSFCDIGWRCRERIGITATIKVGDEKVRIYNIHLDTRINASTRIEQLRPVLDHAGNPKEKIILAGDFNTMPIKWIKGIVPIWYENQRHKVDTALLEEGFTQKIEAKGHTMRQGPIRFRLDSMYAKNASIVRSGIERHVRGSDHLPLWADIEV